MNTKLFFGGRGRGDHADPKLRKVFLIVLSACAMVAVFRGSAVGTSGNPRVPEGLGRDFPASDAVISQQTIIQLKAGESIKHPTQDYDEQSYSVKLEAGQSIVVSIPQHTTAVIMGVFNPGRERIGYVSQQQNEMIKRPMIITSEEAGNYQITVNASSQGDYTISCGLPHQTTDLDKKHSAAQKLNVEYWINIGSNPKIPRAERPRKRLEALQGRLAIYREINDPKLVAVSLADLGSWLANIGDFPGMLAAYEEALEIFGSTGSTADECETLKTLAGDAAHRTGDFEKAIKYLTRAAAISRSKAYAQGESTAVFQLGLIYHALADEQKAMDSYQRSIAVSRSIDPPTRLSMENEAESLTNIGNIYRRLGASGSAPAVLSANAPPAPEKSIEYYKQALEIFRTLKLRGNRRGMVGEADMLLAIGESLKGMGNYSESHTYLDESLTLYNGLKYIPGQVSAIVSIGNLYSLQGAYPKSFEYLKQAVDLVKSGAQNGNYANVLVAIGRDYYRAGATEKAVQLYDEAFVVSSSKGQTLVSAGALFELATVERDLGNFANARNEIEQAIQIVETVRAKISTEELRSSFFSAVKRYYDFYIDLQMQSHKAQPDRGFDALALQASEKSKSRSLLELLSLAQVDIKQGVDSELLERERRAGERLIEKAYKQNILLLRKHTAEEADKVNEEVTTQTDEYQRIQSEIKSKSPRYAALAIPPTLSSAKIQQLLDSGTILLEYSLGERKSYLWVVTSDSIASFDLPGREVIETQARKAYTLLTARNQQTKGETYAKQRARIKAAEAEYPRVAAALTEMLIGPAASFIENKRLLIVPDGALSYISFSALPLPNNEQITSIGQPLGIVHEIISLPSASTLALLRDETQNRKPPPRMLAVFADPVFNQNDVRARSANYRLNKGLKQGSKHPATNVKAETLASRDFERAVSDVGLLATESAGLPRLPFSRREADSILTMSPKALSLKEVDFTASKAEVFSSNLDQYRILHLATHGLLDNQHPELSGVVLSLVDKSGNDIDGFLRLQDIYNLKLNADLVVLSACNTALGKEVRGEGLIGLTRGFMYAGTPRVVASLWKVDDAATAELMTIFYKKMLIENMRPAAALRAAQNEMMKQPRWRSPYYWAPFVLQGEWK